MDVDHRLTVTQFPFELVEQQKVGGLRGWADSKRDFTEISGPHFN